MTPRVCPVHGEYAADGICRWCEPKTLLDVAMSGPKVRPLPVAEATPWANASEAINLPPDVARFWAPRKVDPNVPKGSTLCRCGEYTWAPWCPADEREGVIAGVAHSPEVCVAINSAPPALDAYTAALGPPLRYPLVNHLPLEYDHTEAVIDAETHAAEESRLLAQHAALRWERVARRWAGKHGPWTMRDVAQHWQFFLNKLIALQFKRIAEIGHPLLPVPPKEPKP